METADIQFRCHACRQKFKVRPERIGSKFKCQKCQAPIQVPEADALDNPMASLPTAKPPSTFETRPITAPSAAAQPPPTPAPSTETGPALDQIQFRCHACRQKFAVKPERIGTKFKCQKCQTVVQVPDHHALDNPAASIPKPSAPKPKDASAVKTTTPLDDFDFTAPPPAAQTKAKPAAAEAQADDLTFDLDEPAATPKKSVAPVPAAAVPASPAVNDETPAQPAASVVVPPGKKACPQCAHICPGMALNCPLCQHRFTIERPKPKPVQSDAAEQAGVPAASAPAAAKTPEIAIRPAKGASPSNDVDEAMQLRGKREGKKVEAPMWYAMDQIGAALRWCFVGGVFLIASLFICYQLRSDESASMAFAPIKMLYGIGGRWITSGLIALIGAALFARGGLIIWNARHEFTGEANPDEQSDG